MSLCRAGLVSALLLALALPTRAHAQVLGTGVLPVTEVGAQLWQSTITAGQSVLTAINTATSVANDLLNLEPVTTVITLEGILEDIAELEAIMKAADDLAYDIGSLNRQIAALFDLDTAPSSTSALQERLREMRRMRSRAYAYAMRLQTLARTAIRTINHLVALINAVSAFLGNKQAMQTLVQVNASIQKTLAIQAAQQAAYERAWTLGKQEELLTVESLYRIQAEIMADWPKR